MGLVWTFHKWTRELNWVGVEQTYIVINIGVWIEITTWNWMFLGVEQFERCTISWRMNIYILGVEQFERCKISWRMNILGVCVYIKHLRSSLMLSSVFFIHRHTN